MYSVLFCDMLGFDIVSIDTSCQRNKEFLHVFFYRFECHCETRWKHHSACSCSDYNLKIVDELLTFAVAVCILRSVHIN